MTRDEMYDVILGVSVVTVAYLLWKRQKASQAGPAITVPAPVEVQGSEEGGYWFDLDKLMSGAV